MNLLSRLPIETRLFEDRNYAGARSIVYALGKRAIGVVYVLDYEYGNYVSTVLSRRHDGLIFLDTTHARSQLQVGELPDKDLPETYPWAV